jgi:hypothetical protein
LLPRPTPIGPSQNKETIMNITNRPRIATSFAVLLLLTVALSAHAAAPSATTQAATLITTSSATLNSYVNPNGLSTTIYFQYGLTTSYGSTTSLGGIGTAAGNYGFSISSLTVNTLYHFRIVAYSSGGTTYGSDLTFTTTAQAPSATTQAASSITTSSAQLNSYVNPNGANTTIYYQYGLTTSYGSTTISGNIGTSAGNYGTTVSSLSPNTTYHFRIVAYNSGGTTYGSDLSFTTSAQAPSATTQAASSITSSSAQLNSYVNPNGASTTIYYQYGLTASYGSTTISGNIGTSAGNYGTTASSLSANTTYHFRIVAYNSGGTTYGSDLTFTTSVQAPTATTQAASSIATTSATLNGYINPNGASTTAYFEYGLTTSYGSTTTQGNFGTSPQNISYGISSLTPNTTYHFRIVAYNSGGTTYGSDLTFTTTGQPAPTATTQAATLITTTSAQLNSYVDPNGASTTIYFQYGLTASYGSTTISGGIGTSAGNYGTTASGLTPNTLYHFRIVASNTGGTTYGSDLTFTTSTQGPTAQTLAATAVTTTSAQLNGSINPNGYATTAYFEYGLTASYGSTTPSGNFGTAVQNIGYAQTGLSPNSTYHYRIVASNSQGTSRGTDTTFTTAGSGAPSAQTLAAAAVTTTSAQLNGSINPSGYATTAYFEYGLTTGYGSITPSGNFGTAAQNIGFVQTGLSPNTTYHYRIVASNSQGTTRGLDASFATLPTTTTATTAWVAGTSGLGLRLRSTPSLSASVLVVMPEGSSVTLLGDTQTAEGYLWRHLTYAAQTGWAAAQYLVFNPPQSAPTAPITLRQLQPDGFSPIPAAGSVTASSVILAATPSGSSSQQYSIQIELRPSGTAFSGPTATSDPAQGGSEARITLTSLLNQGYHWRARTIDAYGQASDWVPFSANAADFTVAAPSVTQALFTWSPPQIFVGDTIQFSANAAGTAGLTFSWDFGGGHTGTGATTSQTFSSAGQITATLTITDAQSHQSTHSETITVASRQLADAINKLAQQTSSLFDGMATKAQQCADAVDYFKPAVDGASAQIAIEGLFDAISLGSGLADYKEWTKTTLGQTIVGNVLADVAQNATDFAVGQLYRQHLTASQAFMPNIQTYITQKKAEIELLRQQALAAATSIDPTTADNLARNLQARFVGNLAISDNYSTKAALPVTYADLKQYDEDSWTYLAGEHLFTFSVGLGLAAVGDEADGAAAFMLTVSSTAGMGTLNTLNILAGQSTDAQMLGLSLDVLGQSTFSARIMADNAKQGLQAVVAAQTQSTPAGTMTIEHIAQGGLNVFGYSPRWSTKKAYANITIHNTGTAAADYRVEARYPKTFTTVGLLPFRTYGIGDREYDIYVLSVANAVHLTSGQQTTIQIPYKTTQGGEIPDSLIIYTLTATTPDGRYLEQLQTGHFGTTYLDANGQVVDPASLPSGLLVAPVPLRSTTTQFGNSTICTLGLYANNPFESPVLLTVHQPLPAGTTVIDAGGGVTNGNQLSWDIDLLPGQMRFLPVTLNLPAAPSQQPLQSATASAYDSLNAAWVQFSATNTLVQVTNVPPPQLKPLGFSGAGFGVAVQSFVPGAYRIESTRSFSSWAPVLTTTNVQGTLTIRDAGALTNSVRLYRAVKVQ